MPQNKLTQEVYGIRYAVHDALAEHLKKTPELFDSAEQRTLIEVALNPFFFSLRFNPKGIEAFSQIYKRQPEATVAALCYIQQTIQKQKRGHAGRIRHFLLAGPTTYHKGKLIAVSDLTAKEIGALLKVEPGSVITERKALARRSSEFAFWQRPDVEHYMRTGQHLKPARHTSGKKPGH